jgi:NTP pyrophosphatase (non-canonical NTP hydrolase)
MTSDDYQYKAVAFRLPSYTIEAIFAGLAAEAGEVLGVRQKFLRDSTGKESEYVKYLQDIDKELGDLLWHVAVLADAYGAELSTVMDKNLKKLEDRKNRGKIGGSGDNR